MYLRPAWSECWKQLQNHIMCYSPIVGLRFLRCKKPNPTYLSGVEKVLVDGGYTGAPFAKEVRHTLQATVEVVKRRELHTFKVLPKRWIVERSFAWLDKCRRLWKNCERNLNSSLQFVMLDFLAIILKKL